MAKSQGEISGPLKGLGTHRGAISRELSLDPAPDGAKGRCSPEPDPASSVGNPDLRDSDQVPAVTPSGL